MEYINGRPCKACVSVEDMMRMSREAAKKKGILTDQNALPNTVHSEASSRRKDCPVDKDELGRSTWNLLHTMTVYYPEKPSADEKQAMKDTVESLSKVTVFKYHSYVLILLFLDLSLSTLCRRFPQRSQRTSNRIVKPR